MAGPGRPPSGRSRDHAGRSRRLAGAAGVGPPRGSERACAAGWPPSKQMSAARSRWIHFQLSEGLVQLGFLFRKAGEPPARGGGLGRAQRGPAPGRARHSAPAWPDSGVRTRGPGCGQRRGLAFHRRSNLERELRGWPPSYTGDKRQETSATHLLGSPNREYRTQNGAAGELPPAKCARPGAPHWGGQGLLRPSVPLPAHTAGAIWSLPVVKCPLLGVASTAPPLHPGSGGSDLSSSSGKFWMAACALGLP